MPALLCFATSAILKVLAHCLVPIYLEGLQPSATEISVELVNVKMNCIMLLCRLWKSTQLRAKDM